MGRIFIYTEGEFDYDETIEALKRVFGIFSICPAVVLEDEGFEKLSQEVTEYVKKLYGEKALTFKVNTRRNKKTYPMQSDGNQQRFGRCNFRCLPEYEGRCTQS